MCRWMRLHLTCVFCCSQIGDAQLIHFIYIFVVNIVYYVVHIVCEVDVIANSLVLYLPFCSTLNKNFFSLLFFSIPAVDFTCFV